MPSDAADAFERVTQEQVYQRALQAEGLTGAEATNAAHKALLSKTTMFSPKLLMDSGACHHPCAASVQHLKKGRLANVGNVAMEGCLSIDQRT